MERGSACRRALSLCSEHGFHFCCLAAKCNLLVVKKRQTEGNTCSCTAPNEIVEMPSLPHTWVSLHTCVSAQVVDIATVVFAKDVYMVQNLCLFLQTCFSPWFDCVYMLVESNSDSNWTGSPLWSDLVR